MDSSAKNMSKPEEVKSSKLTSQPGDKQPTLVEMANGIATLSALSAVVKLRHRDLKQRSTVIRELQDKLAENFSTMEEDMNASEEELIIMIRSQFKTAQCNLKQLYKEEMSPLKSTLRKLDTLTDQMSTVSKMADEACNSGSPTQVQTVKDQIKSTCNELKTSVSELPKTDFDKEIEFALTSKHKQAMEEIKKSVHKAGDFKVTSKKGWSCLTSSTSLLILGPIIGCVLFAYPARKHILAFFNQ